jgi:signal transduction histidine kinase
LQEEERRRIARDLHDSFAQTLLGIGLNLAQLDESRNLKGRREKRILAETRKMIKALSRETRSLSYLLHPPLLDEMGLVSAIEEYARGYSARSGIRLELDLDSNTGRLPREIETAIFRVIQEALGNIQKHSGSATAAIRLNKRENKITLEVRDQGRGIHNGEVQKGNLSTRQLGVGILGMRERMHQLGGQLEVVSTDSGTVVRATLPLPTGVEDAAANSDRR